MSFHLTDDQLHALVARDPSDPKRERLKALIETVPR